MKMLDKLVSFISTDSLIDGPKIVDPTHEWADFCELECLLATDILSSEDIKKKVISSFDFGPEDEVEPPLGLRDDRIVGIIEGAIALMKLRKELLKDHYPFNIDKHNQMSRTSEELSNKQILYIMLLLSANLKYINSRQIFTSNFEIICLHCMSSFLPNAKVKLFGSSNMNHINEEYKFKSSRLKERIEELGQFTTVDIHKDSISQINENNYGDGGLDLVATIDMSDSRISRPVFFAQCACGKNAWQEKQLSISENQWAKWLHLYQTSIQKYIFVPAFLMTHDQEWISKTDITSSILIDRFRILSLCKDFDMTVLSYGTI